MTLRVAGVMIPVSDSLRSPEEWGVHFGGQDPSPDLYARLGRRRPVNPVPRDRGHWLDEGIAAEAAVAGSVDLRPDFPPVYDQGQFNSCTGNALAAIIQYWRSRQNLAQMMPSRLYIYWFGRVLDQSEELDAGSSITSVLTGLQGHGYCREQTWPYTAGEVTLVPTDLASAEGAHHMLDRFQQLNSLETIKASLLRKWPVAFQMKIWNSFFQANTNGGLVPMPQDSTTPFVKHAAVFVGFNDQQRILIMRSSWGLQVPGQGLPWGDAGHFYIPYDYASASEMVFDAYAIGGVVDE